MVHEGEGVSDQQPFLPFFVGDFFGATLLWGGEERALYMLMLAYQWSGGGDGLPADLNRLSRVLGYPHDRFLELWPTLKKKFRVKGDVLFNERLEIHREKTVALSEKRSSAGSEGGKASAAKRAAQAAALKTAQQEAERQAHKPATDQATVEAIVRSGLTNSQPNESASVSLGLLKSQANGIQKPSILSDPIHPNPIRSDPCADPESHAHCEGIENQGEPPPGNQGKPPAGLPPNGVARGNGGQPNGVVTHSPEPESSVEDSYPYEQRIMAALPTTPNPPNWSAAMTNARTLVQLELATWSELAEGAERYGRFFKASTQSTNVAAHNFFDRNKGNYWQQAWTVTPLPTKSESRQATNIEAGLKFLAAGSTEP